LPIILYVNSLKNTDEIKTNIMLSSLIPFVATVSFRPNNRASTGFRYFPFELNTTIKLPTAEDVGIMPPDNTAKFSHWRDENGMVLFASTHYTVTEDICLTPVWGISSINEIKEYLANADAGRDPIPLVCTSGGDLSWNALLDAIGETKKNVALDISATTLGLTADNTFDGALEDNAFDGQYIAALVLPASAVTIASLPSLVRHVAGQNVTAFDIDVTRYNRLLTTINFPMLTDLDPDAFTGCQLEKITLGLNTVRANTFAGFIFLRKLVLPDAEEIDSNVCSYCVQLEEAVLPKVKIIGSKAFASCPMLSKVYAPLAEEIDTSAFEGCLLRDITFGLEEIDIERFIGFMTIERVSFPRTLKIGEYAFFSCGVLEKANLPSVTGIGPQAFGLCKSLKTVSLPADNGIIADEAFDSLDLTQVKLGDHWSCGSGNGRMGELINSDVYSGRRGTFVYTGAKWVRV
jgi:hypothetical protein